MPRLRHRPPSYRHHKPSGQAVVTLSGREIYLGRYGSPESHSRYSSLLSEWRPGGNEGSSPDSHASLPRGSITVNELILAYWRFAEGYYRKNGHATGELEPIRQALKPIAKLFGCTPVCQFGPMRLKTVREEMIQSDLCRTVINARINRIRRMFRWAVENQMCASEVLHALQAATPLKRHRCAARESPPVRPVSKHQIEATIPRVRTPVLAMVRLQLLTGMRPCEVTMMRRCDIDPTGAVWTYEPDSHKTDHHGRRRLILIGPRGQGILEDFPTQDPTDFLFSPRDAVTEQLRQRSSRRTARRMRRPRASNHAGSGRRPGSHYTTSSYGRAIGRACDKAGVPRWSPNQLRHNAATFLRKEFGIDAARVILGHSSPAVTELYAELDHAKAIEIMSKVC